MINKNKGNDRDEYLLPNHQREGTIGCEFLLEKSRENPPRA